MARRRNTLVDTIRLLNGEYFDVYRDDVRVTRHSLPSMCPHADPRPPLELQAEGDALAEIEGRYRDLRLIGPEESIHWVGRQDRAETLCRCELAPEGLHQPRGGEWHTLRDLRASIVALVKRVRRYVSGRGAGQVLPPEERATFDAAAERVYGLTQSLGIPLPPVVSNPSVVRVHPHGPTALPVYELPEGLVVSEAEGLMWLSNWRAVRLGVDDRLKRHDRDANPMGAAVDLDTQDAPLDAPVGTPLTLREAFEAVARILFDSATFRREVPSAGVMFRELAGGLTSRTRQAAGEYARAEIQLQAVADAQGCAHRDALAASRWITDAAGHVVLGSVSESMAAAHVRAVPAPDVPGLLRRMRQQVSRAARAVPVESRPADPAPRVRCDESDRSVHLDGKRLAGELPTTVFRFFRAVVDAHPDPITFKRIQATTRGLHGKHPTRDLMCKLPPPLARLVRSGKAGYALELPAN